MPDNSIDSCVTDPPYGLFFMGKKWDTQVPSVEIWKEVYRVLKPGAHLLSFFGTRTYHRGVVNIEDAGFEIRDMVSWIYGSGFPKSTDISKQIDKMKGTKGNQIGEKLLWGHNAGTGAGSFSKNQFEGQTGITKKEPIFEPGCEEAKKWEGWGSALKPAQEPIVLARKSLEEKNIALNVLKYGTGAININDCRILTDLPAACKGTGWASQDAKNAEQGFRPSAYYADQDGVDYQPHNKGRWPANFIHDGSEEVLELFPNSKSCNSPSKAKSKGNILGGSRTQGQIYPGEDGSAARFFYCPKTSSSERDKGCEDLEEKEIPFFQTNNGTSGTPSSIAEDRHTVKRNIHPTVKPIELMKYLCRLITPPEGVILDPFMGSGSTGIAALLEGFSFIGIEREEQYLKIAQCRIDAYQTNTLF